MKKYPEVVMPKEGWTSVARWLDRQADSSEYKNFWAIQKWIRYIRAGETQFKNYTPDELVSFQESAQGKTRYKILDDLVEPYIRAMEGREGYKSKIYSQIRSLFLHNRSELPKDPTFNLNPTKPKVQGELKPEEIRAVIMSSKPAFQAIFMCIFQAALDLSGFDYWNQNGWSELKAQLDSDESPIRIILPGRKKSKFRESYVTYIGDDAIDLIRRYVKEFRSSDAKAIFCNPYNEPISDMAVVQYWSRHCRKLGIMPPIQKGAKDHWTGKNIHELRDSFRTAWSLSGAAPHVGESFMGHIIDDLGYDKSVKNERYVKSEYRKAAPFLNILSKSDAFGLIGVDVVSRLQAELDEAKKGRNSEITILTEKYDRLEKALQKLLDAQAR